MWVAGRGLLKEKDMIIVMYPTVQYAGSIIQEKTLASIQQMERAKFIIRTWNNYWKAVAKTTPDSELCYAKLETN